MFYPVAYQKKKSSLRPFPFSFPIFSNFHSKGQCVKRFAPVGCDGLEACEDYYILCLKSEDEHQILPTCLRVRARHLIRTLADSVASLFVLLAIKHEIVGCRTDCGSAGCTVVSYSVAKFIRARVQSLRHFTRSFHSFDSILSHVICLCLQMLRNPSENVNSCCD